MKPHTTNTEYRQQHAFKKELIKLKKDVFDKNYIKNQGPMMNLRVCVRD